MRRRTAAGLLGALALLAVAPTAHAGSYDVLACGAAPNGANNSWEPVNDDPASIQLTSTCPPGAIDDSSHRYNIDNGLTVRGKPQDGTVTPFFKGGNWRFVAPPGTAISHITIWRLGSRISKDWDVRGYSGFAETYEFCGDAQLCNLGDFRGYTSQGRADFDTGAGEIHWGIGCGNSNGCGTSIQNTPVATMHIYGAAVRLSDPSAPDLDVTGGALWNEGWHTGAQSVSYNATDNAGIRQGRLLVDGQVVNTDALPCDPTRKVPCPNATGRPIALATTGLPDGQHTLILQALDSAGNPAEASRVLAVDNTPPRVVFQRRTRRAPTAVVANVSDPASGVAGGTIEARQLPNGDWRALPTFLNGGQLIAHVEAGVNPRRQEYRARVVDVAGNQAIGSATPTRLTVGIVRSLRGHESARTRRRSGRRLHKRLRVRYGRRVLVRGRVVRVDGQVVAGASVAVYSTPLATGAARRQIATVTTDAKGRFHFVAPRGPSRILRFVDEGSSSDPRSVGAVSIRVPARSTLHVSRRSLHTGQSVVLSGRVVAPGARLPGVGKLIALQAFDRGRWRTFATTHSEQDGRWRYTYRFQSTRGVARYPFRAELPREASFPYDLGFSRALAVVVRG